MASAGSQTTEYRLATRGSAVAGGVMAVGVAAAAAWPERALWPGIALASLAALFAVFVSVSYIVTRARIKRAQVERAMPRARSI